MIMPATSGSPSGTWRGQPGSGAIGSPLGPPAGGSGSNLKTEVLIVISVAGLLLSLASLLIFACFNHNRGRRRLSLPPRKNNVVVPERRCPTLIALFTPFLFADVILNVGC